jgi:hypothetical protein
MKLQQHEWQRGLDLLGLKQAEFQAVLAQGDLARATAALDELKKRAKKAFRKAALDLHPDRNPERESDFQLANNVHEIIQGLSLNRRPPPPPRPHYQNVRVVVVRGSWSSGGATTSYTTSTTTW